MWGARLSCLDDRTGVAFRGESFSHNLCAFSSRQLLGPSRLRLLGHHLHELLAKDRRGDWWGGGESGVRWGRVPPADAGGSSHRRPPGPHLPKPRDWPQVYETSWCVCAHGAVGGPAAGHQPAHLRRCVSAPDLAGHPAGVARELGSRQVPAPPLTLVSERRGLRNHDGTQADPGPGSEHALLGRPAAWLWSCRGATGDRVPGAHWTPVPTDSGSTHSGCGHQDGGVPWCGVS